MKRCPLVVLRTHGNPGPHRDGVGDRTVATIANISQMLYWAGYRGEPLSEELWAVVILGVIWVVLAVVFLALATVIFLTARPIRDSIREQMIHREGDILQAVVLAQMNWAWNTPPLAVEGKARETLTAPMESEATGMGKMAAAGSSQSRKPWIANPEVDPLTPRSNSPVVLGGAFQHSRPNAAVPATGSADS